MLVGPTRATPKTETVQPEKAAQSTKKTLFIDVTNTHLPTPGLRGLSMDAKPVDVDGDGDVVIANEYRPNILLMNAGNGHFTNASTQRLPHPTTAGMWALGTSTGMVTLTLWL